MASIQEWDFVRIVGPSTPKVEMGTYGVVRDVNGKCLVVSVNYRTKIGVLTKDVIKVGVYDEQ